MPPKIRVLIRKLKSAGFRIRSGKDSHRKFVHDDGRSVSVSGKDNADAHHYQVREIMRATAKADDEKE
jgi:predicted RNA binding protein YcfA (HicA-like mRNA interferase family)